MGNKSKKSIICKYAVWEMLLFFLYFVISIFLLFITKSYLLIIAFIICYFVLIIIVEKILINKLFFSVLYKDMDPEIFMLKSEKRESVFLRPHLVYFTPMFRILSTYYSGDYQTTVNICIKKLEYKFSNKCAYFLILSRVYFDIGDNEKLKTVCEKFRNYEKDSTKKIKDNTIKLFESYLKEDFDECEKILEDSLSKQTSKTSNIVKMNQVFYTAAIKYYSGDKDTAKKLFEKVICEAPKLNYAKLSEKYIIAIDSSDKSVLSFPEILPEL